MRDISNKVTTLRQAHARSILRVTEKTIALIKNGKIPKGDPLEIAKVAAIQAAKNTSQIIPYCHQISLDYVGVEFKLNTDSIEIDVVVKATHKTGVEMEAMTAASVAALTIYDMVKMLDDFAEMEAVSLVSKKGGKSDYRTSIHREVHAAVLVLSDRAHAGDFEDRSGKIIIEKLESQGVKVKEYLILPDEQEKLSEAIERICQDQSTDLIFTTGGTGIGPRDITPDVIAKLIEKPLPGIVEAMRNYGQSRNQFAMLSRSLAGIKNNTIIISMPGSTGGVTDALNVLFPPVLHALKMLEGESHEGKNHKSKEKASAK